MAGDLPREPDLLPDRRDPLRVPGHERRLRSCSPWASPPRSPPSCVAWSAWLFATGRGSSRSAARARSRAARLRADRRFDRAGADRGPPPRRRWPSRCGATCCPCPIVLGARGRARRAPAACTGGPSGLAVLGGVLLGAHFAAFTPSLRYTSVASAQRAGLLPGDLGRRDREGARRAAPGAGVARGRGRADRRAAHHRRGLLPLRPKR